MAAHLKSVVFVLLLCAQHAIGSAIPYYTNSSRLASPSLTSTLTTLALAKSSNSLSSSNDNSSEASRFDWIISVTSSTSSSDIATSSAIRSHSSAQSLVSVPSSVHLSDHSDVLQSETRLSASLLETPHAPVSSTHNAKGASASFVRSSRFLGPGPEVFSRTTHVVSAAVPSPTASSVHKTSSTRSNASATGKLPSKSTSQGPLITSKPYFSTTYTYTDDDPETTYTVVNSWPACIAVVPWVSNLVWTTMYDDDNDDDDDVDSSTVCVSCLSTSSKISYALPTTVVWSTAAHWSGKANAKNLSSQVTITYPNTYWDYDGSMIYHGSTIGAPHSCIPYNEVGDSTCAPWLTFPSHPAYADAATTKPTMNSNPARYVPTWVVVSTNIDFFLSAFPHNTALLQCSASEDYALHGTRKHMTKPEIAQHPTDAPAQITTPHWMTSSSKHAQPTAESTVSDAAGLWWLPSWQSAEDGVKAVDGKTTPDVITIKPATSQTKCRLPGCGFDPKIDITGLRPAHTAAPVVIGVPSQETSQTEVQSSSFSDLRNQVMHGFSATETEHTVVTPAPVLSFGPADDGPSGWEIFTPVTQISALPVEATAQGVHPQLTTTQHPVPKPQVFHSSKAAVDSVTKEPPITMQPTATTPAPFNPLSWLLGPKPTPSAAPSAVATHFTVGAHTFSVQPGAVIFHSSTVPLGATLTIGSGTQTTAVAVKTGSASGLLVVVGTSTSVLPMATSHPAHATAEPDLLPTSLTMQGQTVAITNGAVVVGGQTLSMGASITIGTGPAATIAALSTDASGHTQIAIGGSTVVLTPSSPSSPLRTAPLVINGQTVTPVSDGILIQGQTLTPGALITIGSGSLTTVVAMNTNEIGDSVLAVGKTSTTIPAMQHAIAVGGQTVTETSGQFFVAGKTLTPGQSVTVGSGTQTTLIAVLTDAHGHTDVVIGSSTRTLPTSVKAIMTAGLSILPAASGAISLNGHLLPFGATTVIGSGTALTTVVLTTNSRGETVLAEPQTTVALDMSSATDAGFDAQTSASMTSIPRVITASSTFTSSPTQTLPGAAYAVSKSLQRPWITALLSGGFWLLI